MESHTSEILKNVSANVSEMIIHTSILSQHSSKNAGKAFNIAGKAFNIAGKGLRPVKRPSPTTISANKTYRNLGHDNHPKDCYNPIQPPGRGPLSFT